jgi:hypothetical protein
VTGSAASSNADDPRPAADARVAAFLAQLDQLEADIVSRLGMAASSETPERDAAREEAFAVARAAGLEATVHDARATVRETLRRRMDEGSYRPTMVGLNWGISAGTVEDRVAITQAAEDAVTAVVVEPFASVDVLTELTSAFDLVDRGHAASPSVDLSRATAEALSPATSGRSSIWLLVILGVAVVASIAVATGIGRGVGLAGLAVAIGAMLVWLVMRGRVSP